MKRPDFTSIAYQPPRRPAPAPESSWATPEQIPVPDVMTPGDLDAVHLG